MRAPFRNALISLALGSCLLGPMLSARSETLPATAAVLPGREGDGHLASIAYRLAVAGFARCPELRPATGLVLQHLSQFELADRAGLTTALRLDHGPGVIAVVAGGPADRAGIVAGDVILTVDGIAIPADASAALPFDAARARARADTVESLLARPHPVTLTLLRGDTVVAVRMTPRSACPMRVHLARSPQLNAFADGDHVLLTTGLLARLHGDDQIAFVVAHEMAHNILHHAALMRGGDVRQGLGRTIGRSGAIVRQAERDADRLGGELMLDAGYDPVAGVRAVSALGGGDLGLRFLASHDGAEARIAAMRALVAERSAR